MNTFIWDVRLHINQKGIILMKSFNELEDFFTVMNAGVVHHKDRQWSRKRGGKGHLYIRDKKMVRHGNKFVLLCAQ
jgi:hypothetical protein